MEACQPCLEEISETIKSEFPNYTKNKYIIFFSNDIENRLRKNFLGKQITTSLKKEKIPLSKYTTDEFLKILDILKIKLDYEII